MEWSGVDLHRLPTLDAGGTDSGLGEWMLHGVLTLAIFAPEAMQWICHVGDSVAAGFVLEAAPAGSSAERPSECRERRIREELEAYAQVDASLTAKLELDGMNLMDSQTLAGEACLPNDCREERVYAGDDADARCGRADLRAWAAWGPMT